MKNVLLKKINNKSLRICIIGLGYVGLPLSLRFIKKKIKVYGIDKDKNKINLLKDGKNYIKTIDTKYFKNQKNYVSSEYGLVNKADVIIICLPTPLKNKKPDLSFIKNCIDGIMPFLKEGQTLILESTVYPYATDEILITKLKKKFNLGKNFFVGYSPERENPGDKNFSYQKTPKVVSGKTKECAEIVEKIYKLISKKVYLCPSIEVAETSKLLENIYRAINIGLINEFKLICKRLNLDVFEIIEAASTKNFGFQKFLPGPGWGGHCIPIDPFYLAWKSKQTGYDPKLIFAAGEINTIMTKQIFKEISNFFKNKKIKILILGLSYKKNVDDDRESPAYEFFKLFHKKKIYFDYFDPYFINTTVGRVNKIYKRSIKFNEKNLKKYDATLIVTDHDNIDYLKLYKYSKHIFDSRGIMKAYIKNDILKKISYV